MKKQRYYNFVLIYLFMKNVKSSILDVYSRYNFTPIKAKGVYLYDKNGNKKLDFLGGVAVNVLGYNNSVINNAIKKQIDKGFFSQSNYFYNDDAEKLAKKLCKISGIIDGKVFFQNSGAEANECAIKIARKRFNTINGTKYNEIICMTNAFHGRTIATISATLREKLTDGFEPLIEGFKIAEFNNIESVKKTINKNTCAIMLETIQGEGGILPCDKKFLKDLRKICDEKNILLIVDEIQCGNGRTGKFFAYQNYDIIPDIITIAKGLAGGLPIGACIVKKEVAEFMKKGSHGSTFGGNALCCCIGNACINKTSNKQFLKNVKNTGDYFNEKLLLLTKEYPKMFKSVKGIGLMVGLEIDNKINAHDFAIKLLNNGLCCATAGCNQIRFLPPLIIAKKHIDECIKIIIKTYKECL